MPGISDLFCGCSFPSVARPTATAANTPTHAAALGGTDGEATPADRQPPASSSTCPAPAAPGRGLVQACLYEADPFDDIDLCLCAHLRGLDRAFVSSLLLRRFGIGDYELDGKRVRLKWCNTGDAGSDEEGADRTLVVKEGDEGDPTACEMPLLAYLQQVADVAASLGGRSAGAPLVARVPAHQRLTFTAVAPPQPVDDMGVERLRSMRMACEQARLREQAAEEYDRRERDRSIGRVRGASPAAPLCQVPFEQHMRSGSAGSISSNGRAPTPDASLYKAMTNPPRSFPGAAGVAAAAPVGATVMTVGGLARLGTPPHGTFAGAMSRGVRSASTSFGHSRTRTGSFATTLTPGSGPPSRASSVHNLPTSCRNAGAAVPLPVRP
mmetsp:Transcript_127595/g.367109  ORF Transcript_127595/g.367109 Transcript_127595/m.367109 type:complete len:382 (+) Transcript_127595:187-1332(+)